MLGQDLILEFTKEMFTMKEFEQVSHEFVCLSLYICDPTAFILLQLFLPTLLRFVAGLFRCSGSYSRNSGLNVLVSLIFAKAPPPTDGSMAFETYPLLFTGQTTGSDTKKNLNFSSFISSRVPWNVFFFFFFSCRIFSDKEPSSTSDQPGVPELVLSLVPIPEEETKFNDLSLLWSSLVLLPHLRLHISIVPSRKSW